MTAVTHITLAAGAGRAPLSTPRAQLAPVLLVHDATMKADRSLPPLMMVDDNTDDAVLFARRLKEAGVPNPLLHFRNGGDAFMFLNQFCTGRKQSEERPCLVFLDVNMPNLSGFDVLAWARQQPALRGMKIVMLSGATEPWDAKIAEKLGADDYLMKFPDANALGEVLASHLAPAVPLRAPAAPQRAPADPR